MVAITPGRCGRDGSSTTTTFPTESIASTPTSADRTSPAKVPMPHARGGKVETIAARIEAAAPPDGRVPFVARLELRAVLLCKRLLRVQSIGIGWGLRRARALATSLASAGGSNGLVT